MKQQRPRPEESHAYLSQIQDMAAAARPRTVIENLIADAILFVPKLVAEVVSLGALRQEVDERREELKVCSQRMREAWGLFASAKYEMLGRDKHEAFVALKSAQDELDAACEEWKQAKGRLQEMTVAEHNERVQARIDDLEDRRERLSGVLERKRAHLEKLRDDRDSAWSDAFRERVEGWIDEEEAAIVEIEEKLEGVESRLSALREQFW